MKTKKILITGSNGAIGQGLCCAYKAKGWYVVGTDKDNKNVPGVDNYISIDLDKLCNNEVYRDEKVTFLKNITASGLDVIINNAATQIISPFEKLSFENWQTTINVNLSSTFILIQAIIDQLKLSKGCIVNISSIHSTLTKKGFSSYATSKAGLVGLTKSLSVELGEEVRVNAICPAAIDTKMLHDGFKNTPEELIALKNCHPTKSIGTINDVINAALYITNTSNTFLNGLILNLDGGISSRLHDPD